MTGTCQCGGKLRETEWVVTTDKTLLEPAALPVSVTRTTCYSCKRTETVAVDAHGKRAFVKLRVF